jgi:hypothetical protein
VLAAVDRLDPAASQPETRWQGAMFDFVDCDVHMPVSDSL